MDITFYGAAGEVTGSCTLLQQGDTQVLVDCGAFQGGREELEKNSEPLGFDPTILEAVAVTHAHFDHCGRLPVLIAKGYKGPIYCTAATARLIEFVLQDSLHIMESDYLREGILPFFNEDHFRQTLKQITTVKYNEPIKVRDNLLLEFHDAGHIFGSASIEVKFDNKTLVFSGDLGNINTPIIKDTEEPPKADVVVMESTYATRDHEPPKQRVEKLVDALKYTAEHNGVLLIPAFAIERTQDLLWELHELADAHKLPKMDFYLDSPLAIKVTRAFKEFPENYDSEAKAERAKKHDFLNFSGLKLTETADESKAINHSPNPKVIIAGAGMMNGGRIIFHLRKYLPDPSTTLLVVGYQAHNTLGRKILHGEKEVRIFGQPIEVNARVVQVDSYSAHADDERLTEWVSSIKPTPQKVFLNHGDRDRSEDMAENLRIKYKIDPIVPEEGKSYEI